MYAFVAAATCSAAPRGAEAFTRMQCDAIHSAFASHMRARAAKLRREDRPELMRFYGWIKRGCQETFTLRRTKGVVAAVHAVQKALDLSPPAGRRVRLSDQLNLSSVAPARQRMRTAAAS